MNLILGVLIYICALVAIIYGTFVFSKKSTGKYGYYVVILLVLFILGISSYLVLGPFNLYPDAVYYHDGGLEILKWWEGTGPNPYGEFWNSLMNKRAWPTVIAAIYWLVGVQPAAILLFSIVLLGSTSVFLASSITVLSPDKFDGKLFTYFFLIAPFVFIFGVSLGREAIYWLATSILIYGSSKLFQRKNLESILPLAAGSLLLIVFRPNLGIPQIYAFGIPLFIMWVFRSFPINLLRVALIAILGTLIGFSVFPAKELITADAYDVVQTRYFLSEGANSGFSSIEINLESETIEPSVQPTTSTKSQEDGNSFWDYGLYSLQTLPRGMFGPFPAEFSFKPVMVFSEINLFYWIIIVGLTIYGIARNLRRAQGLLFLSISLLIITIISSLLTNYGILIRFRAIAEITLIPYAFSVFMDIIGSKRLKNTQINSSLRVKL